MSLKNGGPKHKRLKRDARLKVANQWLPSYKGKSLIKGYRKHFGTSQLCAALELQMLGYDISDDTIKQLKADELKRQKIAEERKRKKEMLISEEADLWSDDYFSFIAGYTSGGFPFGITWQEEALFEKMDQRNQFMDSCDSCKSCGAVYRIVHLSEAGKEVNTLCRRCANAEVGRDRHLTF